MGDELLARPVMPLEVAARGCGGRGPYANSIDRPGASLINAVLLSVLHILDRLCPSLAVDVLRAPTLLSPHDKP